MEGGLDFTVGDAAAGTPHRFVNRGTGWARHIDIHTSRRMSTEWPEDV